MTLELGLEVFHSEVVTLLQRMSGGPDDTLGAAVIAPVSS